MRYPNNFKKYAIFKAKRMTSRSSGYIKIEKKKNVIELNYAHNIKTLNLFHTLKIKRASWVSIEYNHTLSFKRCVYRDLARSATDSYGQCQDKK